MSAPRQRDRFPLAPARIAKLRRDPRGYPIPWFVAFVDGKPDFRVIDPQKFSRAIEFKRCWICGEELGRYVTFVVGPMCVINRLSAEPPVHTECATFAAEACPFLRLPQAQRRLAGLPEERQQHHLMAAHNPGATCLWTTREYEAQHRGSDCLFALGDPTSLAWYSCGRLATREEAQAALALGRERLTGNAAMDHERLAHAYEGALLTLPKTGEQDA